SARTWVAYGPITTLVISMIRSPCSGSTELLPEACIGVSLQPGFGVLLFSGTFQTLGAFFGNDGLEQTAVRRPGMRAHGLGDDVARPAGKSRRRPAARFAGLVDGTLVQEQGIA